MRNKKYTNYSTRWISLIDQIEQHPHFTSNKSKSVMADVLKALYVSGTLSPKQSKWLREQAAMYLGIGGAAAFYEHKEPIILTQRQKRSFRDWYRTYYPSEAMELTVGKFKRRPMKVSSMLAQCTSDTNPMLAQCNPKVTPMLAQCNPNVTPMLAQCTSDRDYSQANREVFTGADKKRKEKKREEKRNEASAYITPECTSNASSAAPLRRAPSLDFVSEAEASSLPSSDTPAALHVMSSNSVDKEIGLGGMRKPAAGEKPSAEYILSLLRAKQAFDEARKAAAAQACH